MIQNQGSQSHLVNQLPDSLDAGNIHTLIVLVI